MNELVLTKIDGHVALATLNRPEVLNALSIPLVDELIEVFERWDRDPNVHVIVLTGNERAFAAGADIGEMAEASAVDMNERRNLARWQRIRAVRQPIIAAVSGYALGGGCELAMLCDMIVASESAFFGQPEINIGIIPGAGGTQRLTRAIGKYRAMELILTGRFFNAAEAFEAGLVTKVVAKEQYLEEAMRLAHEIAGKPRIALQMAKEAINQVDDMPLSAGLNHERKLCYMLFATEDQKEGMRAFQDKRPPEFSGR